MPIDTLQLGENGYDGHSTKVNRENILIWKSVAHKVVAVLDGFFQRFKILLTALALLLV
jgi:hypothetical protein